MHETHYVLGVRAEPRGLHWAVVEGTQNEPVLRGDGHDEAPASFDEPAALSWLRQRLLDLIDTYHPVAVGIRYPESFGARRGNLDSARRRSRVEGVALEAAHSRGLPIFTGALARIAGRLRTRRAKQYIEAGTLRTLDLSSVPRIRREAVLVAVAQLPQGTMKPVEETE